MIDSAVGLQISLLSRASSGLKYVREFKPSIRKWLLRMNQMMISKLLRYSLLVMAGGIGLINANTGWTQEKIDFDRDIKPIFAAHCAVCHDENSDDFDITDKDDAINYVVAGFPDKSEIYSSLISDDEDVLMPPPDNEEGAAPLTKEQIELVKKWVAVGAPWSGEEPTIELKNDDPGDGDGKAAGADGEEEKSIWYDLWVVVGRFHPAIVHFPIALLIISALFAIGGLRGSYVANDIAYYCLWLGALSSILAVAFGWSFTWKDPLNSWDTVDRFTDTNNKYFLHGAGGVAVAVLALIVALMAMGSRRSDPDSGGSLWKICTLVLAGVVGWVGHEGGELVYKGKLYDPVWEFVDRLRSGAADDDNKAEEQDGAKQHQAENDESKKEDPAKNDQQQESDEEKKRDDGQADFSQPVNHERGTDLFVAKISTPAKIARSPK
jgi:uncharacterized membrane protein